MILPVVAAVLATALPAPLPNPLLWNTSVTKALAPGVTLLQEQQKDPPLLVNVLTVDPTAHGVTIAATVANDSLTNHTGDIRRGRETVPAMALRKGALAVVNGDYFPFTGDPLGLGISDGEIYSEPYVSATVPGRAAIGWLPSGRAVIGIPRLIGSFTTQDGTVLPITGVDRLTSTDDLNDAVVTTERFGPTSASRGKGTEIVLVNADHLPLSPGRIVSATVNAVVTGSPSSVAVPSGGLVVSLPAGSPRAATAISHFHVGELANLMVSLIDITPSSIGSSSTPWNLAVNAIGGGPILLRDERIIVDDEAEGEGGLFSTAPHARTAVGAANDGKTIIVTVDAGSALSSGVSLLDMARIMQQNGAVNAINLDGGASTNIVVRGVTLNFPYGSTYERPVADMLSVTAPLEITIGDSAEIVLPRLPLVPGETYELGVRSGDQMISAASSAVIWNGPAGVGFVDQMGDLHVFKSGHGTISAVINGTRVSKDIDVPAVPTAQTTQPTPGLQPAKPPDAASQLQP